MVKDRDNCLFCRIADHTVNSQLLYEDDLAAAFLDINPRAPQHVLIIPKKHIPSLAELKPEDAALMGHLVSIASRIAAEQGLAEKGYRLVCNCGEDGGQEIPHLHFHLLGGRFLGPYTFPLESDNFNLADMEDE